MSRDRVLHLPHEHAHPASAGSGRDMPRGGRGPTGARPRPRESTGVRDALVQQLNLPRGEAREPVVVNGRRYDLRGSEVRALATVGAFRVVHERDMEGAAEKNRWHGDLERLREAGFIELVKVEGRATMVTLTRDGQAVLECHRRSAPHDTPQAYYAGIVKPRETRHDAELYRAYVTAANRLSAGGARVERVVLDYELKREYQRFLQEHNRAHGRRSGRPDRSPAEVRAWASEHGLPVVDDRVRFPDVRIEYERPDGSRAHEDLELATEHYTSRQMGAKRAAGFVIHRSSAARIGGKGGSGRGSPFDPHAAEKVLR